MTSREALSEVDSILCDYKCRLKPDNCLYCEDNNEDRLLDIIERDITLVEDLKRVLSKVVNVVYQPEIVLKENKAGFIDYYLNHEYKIAPDFDVEVFRNIIDQLGYTLVKKEN